MPALLTTTSNAGRPASAPVTDASSATSSGTTSAPSSGVARTGSRTPATTVSPRRTNAATVAAPMPPPAPVTSTLRTGSTLPCARARLAAPLCHDDAMSPEPVLDAAALQAWVDEAPYHQLVRMVVEEVDAAA